MTASYEPLLVFTTFPEAEVARSAVQTLVEEGLAACGNLLPGVESIYQWQGKVEISTEVLVLLKTEAARYEELALRLRNLHPYEVPEIIAVPIIRGLPAYLDWLSASVNR